MTHVCPDCGMEHGGPEPVVVEDNSDKAAAELGDASVEIARVEAGRDVEVAKITAKTIDAETEAELARLRARVEVLETSTLPAPEPEPVPIVVPDPGPEPEPEPEPAPAPPESEPPAAESKPRGYWG